MGPDRLGQPAPESHVFRAGPAGRYPEFKAQSIARGKDEADGHVVAGLYLRAVGHTGPDGRYYPPEPNAESLWLRNRQPHLWRDKHEHEHNGSLDDRVALMPTDERLAKARELIMFGQAYLPLLARQRAEEEAKVIEHESAEASEAERISAPPHKRKKAGNFNLVRLDSNDVPTLLPTFRSPLDHRMLAGDRAAAPSRCGSLIPRGGALAWPLMLGWTAPLRHRMCQAVML